MWSQDEFPALFTILLLTVQINTVGSKEACSSPYSNLAGTVYKSTFASFDPDSELYRTDTTIEGINQGTDQNSGVIITFVRSAATPVDLNLNSLFELITLPVSNSQFGSRTFIRLKSVIDSGNNTKEAKIYQMQLEIRDINDKSPIFRNAPYSASVVEVTKNEARTQNPRIGTVQVTVDGRDLNDNPLIFRAPRDVGNIEGNNQVLPDNFNNHPPVIQAVPSPLQFLENIPVGTVLLSNITLTDADAQIVVTVQDRGEPTLSDSTTVTISVVRNTAPFFPAPKSKTVNILNSHQVNTEVTTYTAKDSDNEPQFNQVTYSMVTDATSGSLFRLDSNSGRITLISSLTADDASQYSLIIVARDNGGLSDTGIVVVNVNRNNFDPQWLPIGGPYSAAISVTENRPVLETVYTLSAQDLDIQEPGQTRVYTILSTASASQHFQVTGQGQVQIIRSLVIDRSVNQYVLTIQLRDGGNRVAAQQFTLTINIIRNSNPPVFFDTSYYKEIEETLTVGSSILQVQASDQDPELQFRTITYTLLATIAGNNLFSMEMGTGIVRVKSALTSNPTVTFDMVALAADGGSPSKSANAMVTIKINRNRNTPVWNTLNYQTVILETLPVDVPLTLSPGALTATDSDAQPPNNQVNYRLKAVVARSGSTTYPSEQGNFAVSSSGQVTVRSPLNGLTATTYELLVEAYDLGDPSRISTSNATVTVNVQRNRAPSFPSSSYAFTMREDATVTPQTIIGQVSATDPDTGATTSQLIYYAEIWFIFSFDQIPQFNTLSYAIESLGVGSPAIYFNMDSNGRITLRNLVGGISHSEFRFLVRVSDNGVPSLSDEAVVTITINRNLWAPAFNPLNYAITIQENLPAGSETGVTVSATDQDINAIRLPQTIRLSFLLLGTTRLCSTYFDVVAISGKVLVKQPLYTATATQYQLNVRVSDKAENPLTSQQTATVTITVERNLFAPVFQNLPSIQSLPRTSGVGFNVFTAFSNDSDTKSPFNVVSYSLVSGTNEFSINPTTGIVTLQTNSLSRAEYVLTVEARDGANIPRRTYSLLTLIVDSNLAKPTWVRPGAGDSYAAQVTIQETQDYVTSVYDFQASDADNVSPYNTVRYVVEGEGNAPNFFTVADNGQTFLKTSLLQRTETQFVLLVRAEDGGNPPRQADNKVRLTINIIRNNNAPQWQNPMTSALISQQAAVGQAVGTSLLAIDSDVTFNVVRYEIIGDGNAGAFFTIPNPSVGQITVANSLASSSDLIYYIRVRAYDNGVPAKDNVTVVTVTVERNNFAPEITTPNVAERIPETQDLGVTIATVRAQDRDTQVPHNQIRFRLFVTQPASDYFDLDILTGNLYVKRELTLDTATRYQMLVQAYDMGSPSKTSATNATVTIDVYRNSQTPFFTGGPFNANIPETTVVGTSVLQVNFGDSDTDAPFNTVTVSAIGDDKALTYFRLESNGRLVVNSDLTADADTEYLMRILARDGGSSSRTATTVATITVQRNINNPAFERQSYNETILETRQLGLSFLQVKATDNDRRAPYNTVRYSISSDAGSALGAQYFMVDEVTGNINLRQSPMLDNARTVDYTFNVNAVDGGGLQATLPASVRVTVIRNTNAPVFTNLPRESLINHNTSVGATVYTVAATDPDPGVFGQLTYSLTGDGDSRSVFAINPNSGAITLQQSVFQGTTTLYTLRVRVQDGGSPSKEAVSTLTLTVQRNFEAPRFVQSSYSMTVREDRAIGFSFGRLAATDSDFASSEIFRNYIFFNSTEVGCDQIKFDFLKAVEGFGKDIKYKCNIYVFHFQSPNNVVQYYFTAATPSERFLINPTTGDVSIRKDLTTEETKTYTFRVQAADSGFPRRTSPEIPLTITVQRNDFDPLFGNLPNSVTIRADTAQGSTVYTVNSTDADTVNDFQRREYDIVGDDAATGLFTVDQTERIFTTTALTNDPSEQYRVRLRVRDFGTPRRSSTGVLLVNIVRNLFNPSFIPTQYQQTIPETQTLGASILQVTSTDADTTAPNNVPTYTLTGNALGLQYFQVNPGTGVISLYKDLRDDAADTQTYTFTVSVRDNGTPSLTGTNTATVTIQVNRNSQPPVFLNTPYRSSITRSVQDNSAIPRVNVATTDADTVSPFNVVTVTVIGDDSAASLFRLDGSNIRVQNAANLAAGTANTYKLRLLAEDGGSPKKTATATVDITVNRNLAAPQFNPATYSQTIIENFPVGSEIVTVTATDSDPQAPNNQFKFSLKGDTIAKNYFYISPDSGQISLKQTIRGTGFNQFKLQIIATDEGIPPLLGQGTVIVIITDSPYSNNSCESNIYAPIFTAPLYFVNILEGDYSMKNQLLLQV
ncbi:protocadherin Fat 4-like [Saccostrea echinata]|uniref:protocadherin Fat 4-like n=1 Tax=Saccostrea echinata TaxID=191078 RepID=UPI002A806C5C|nr:protocadherin Fat 4-like [Saccostrea echinata]